MHIRWGNTTTSLFFVSNGVRQGGILTPILFNVYMDQLSVKLNASKIRGNIGGGVLVNHIWSGLFDVRYGPGVCCADSFKSPKYDCKFQYFVVIIQNVTSKY